MEDEKELWENTIDEIFNSDEPNHKKLTAALDELNKLAETPGAKTDLDGEILKVKHKIGD